MITYPTTIEELEQEGIAPIVFDTFGDEIQAKLLDRGWVKRGPAPPSADKQAYDKICYWRRKKKKQKR